MNYQTARERAAVRLWRANHHLWLPAPLVRHLIARRDRRLEGRHQSEREARWEWPAAKKQAYHQKRLEDWEASVR